MKTEGRSNKVVFFRMFGVVWWNTINECLNSLIWICKLRNVLQITSDFPTCFRCLSKCMHVMWFTVVDWLRQFKITNELEKWAITEDQTDHGDNSLLFANHSQTQYVTKQSCNLSFRYPFHAWLFVGELCFLLIYTSFFH